MHTQAGRTTLQLHWFVGFVHAIAIACMSISTVLVQQVPGMHAQPAAAMPELV
jgi:hypothetical protein